MPTYLSPCRISDSSIRTPKPQSFLQTPHILRNAMSFCINTIPLPFSFSLISAQKLYLMDLAIPEIVLIFHFVVFVFRGFEYRNEFDLWEKISGVWEWRRELACMKSIFPAIPPFLGPFSGIRRRYSFWLKSRREAPLIWVSSLAVCFLMNDAILKLPSSCFSVFGS